MYHVDIVNSGGSDFKVRSGEYKFTIDTKGGGINPSATLLASLGACAGVYIRKYAEGSKLGIGEFSISVDAEFAKEGCVYFKDIKISIDLKGADIDERRKEALLRFVRNCPVHNTLRNNPNVAVEII